jgi:hypothetical protein
MYGVVTPHSHCTHYTLYSLCTVLTIHCTHYALYSLCTALTIHASPHNLAIEQSVVKIAERMFEMMDSTPGEGMRVRGCVWEVAREVSRVRKCEGDRVRVRGFLCERTRVRGCV